MEDPEKRFAIAQRILARAKRLGIDESDVLIDPLVLTVSAESNAALVTLQTAGLISDRLGLNMTLGASNLSFGLPDCHLINNAFLVVLLMVRSRPQRVFSPLRADL